jgi:hypothetical protein
MFAIGSLASNDYTISLIASIRALFLYYANDKYLALVPRQATFARDEMARSSSLSRLRLRQALDAVQQRGVHVHVILNSPALLVAAQSPTRPSLVVDR